MRIIGGEFRSRRLTAPRGLIVRPTSDRARESLFSVLGAAVIGGPFLDLFAGTGSVGLEALSRGAGPVVFVESDRTALRTLQANMASLDVAGRCRVLPMDWLRACRLLQAENMTLPLVFADPPYGKGLSESCLLSASTGAILQPAGLLVIEHRRTETLPEPPPGLGFRRRLAAGEAVFSIYRKEEQA